MVYPPSPYADPAVPLAPTVNRDDKRRGWQLILGIVLFIAAQLVSSIPLTVYVLATGNSGGFGDNSENPVFAGLLLFGMLLGSAAAVGGYLFIVGVVGGTPGSGLAGKNKVLELTLGVVTGIALIALAVGFIWLLGGYSISGIHTGPGLWVSLLFALAMGIGPGFMEEILFRGFGLRVLDAWWGWLPALLVTSALFGLVHITNPEASVFGAIAIALEAGILLGAAYLLTRRLWLAIGIHTGWNFAQAGIFSSDVSGTGDRQGLFLAEWHGASWLTGGDMGIEASVVTVVVALTAGVLMLVLAHNHGMLRPSVKREKATVLQH